MLEIKAKFLRAALSVTLAQTHNSNFNVRTIFSEAKLN